MSAICFFLKYCMYAADRHREAVVTLKIHNSRLGATHLLTLLHPCFGFDPYFVNYWARSTNQPLC